MNPNVTRQAIVAARTATRDSRHLDKSTEGVLLNIEEETIINATACEKRATNGPKEEPMITIGAERIIANLGFSGMDLNTGPDLITAPMKSPPLHHMKPIKGKNVQIPTLVAVY